MLFTRNESVWRRSCWKRQRLCGLLMFIGSIQEIYRGKMRKATSSVGMNSGRLQFMCRSRTKSARSLRHDSKSHLKSVRNSWNRDMPYWSLLLLKVVEEISRKRKEEEEQDKGTFCCDGSSRWRQTYERNCSQIDGKLRRVNQQSGLEHVRRRSRRPRKRQKKNWGRRRQSF